MPQIQVKHNTFRFQGNERIKYAFCINTLMTKKNQSQAKKNTIMDINK